MREDRAKTVSFSSIVLAKSPSTEIGQCRNVVFVHQLHKVLPQPEVVGGLRGKDRGHGVLGHVVQQLQDYNRVVAVAAVAVAAVAVVVVAVASTVVLFLCQILFTFIRKEV